MSLVPRLLVGLVAAQHVLFALLEMVLWTRPAGRKVFGTTAAFAEESAGLAKNQGLYNLFLVAGLVWSEIAGEPLGRSLATFFLGCVIVAGIYGGLTVKRTILLVQGVPAAVALATVLLL